MISSTIYLIFILPLIKLSSEKPYSRDIWRGPLPESTYFYSDYKLPPNLMPVKIYVPEPPNCPETGKTLCNDVDQYPVEKIFEIVKSTKSPNFNFTSVFLDESSNDQEPILKSDSLKEKLQDKGLRKNETRLSSKPRGVNNNNTSNTRNARKVNLAGSLSKQILDAWSSVKDGFNGSNKIDSSNSTRVERNSSTSDGETSADDSVDGKRVRRKSSSLDSSSPEEICGIKSMYITPRAALNDRSEWKYIVNLGERDVRLKQIIKVDVCAKANGPCSSSLSLPFGFKTRCKQKYIKKKLLSLDTNGQSTSTDNFFVPSCCACEIYRA